MLTLKRPCAHASAAPAFAPTLLLPCLALPLCRSDKVVIVSAGMQADMQTLHKTLQYRHVMYQHNHRKPMSCPAMAQLLSNTLYYKRFFPYYTFNLCAGLDEEGEWGGGSLQSVCLGGVGRGRTTKSRGPWRLGCDCLDGVTLQRGECYGKCSMQLAVWLPGSVRLQALCQLHGWPVCMRGVAACNPSGAFLASFACTLPCSFCPPCSSTLCLLHPGRGAVYTYDAIGSYERVGYSCQGSGKELIQPVLDNQLKAASPLVLPPKVSCAGAGVAPMAAAGRERQW